MEARKTDALIAGFVLVLAVAGSYGGLSSSGLEEQELAVPGTVLLTVSSVALVFRRSAPVWVGAITVGCGVTYYAARYPGIFAAAPAEVAVYTAASLGRRRLAIGLTVAATVGIGVPIALSARDPSPGGIAMISGWLVAVVVAGEVMKNRRAYLHEVEQRAAEAERTREEAALRRAGEERLWIAQELHDTLTHNISVINVQVSVAMQLMDAKPEQARSALAAIKDSGHEAMRELRTTLGVLRQADEDDVAAGLARLPRLMARAEAAGLPVTYQVTGQAGELAVDVDRAAYRIAQEAFTNVLRHAGRASISVTAEYQATTLVLRVENDGDSGPVKQGMGLIGMRERAVAVGGSLTAGPRAGGGFAVRAELPLAGVRG
ncbi:histidine kinase [Nonomuraea sp. NPDC046570]|uniref:sensor histidine kinase n=1 Tax=Nonomuraea sp. NPDC046570 TaxID=3155255 RepID=UPI0033C10460